MEFLTSSDVRQNAGVNQINKYIFANTQNSKSYASGWHCINEILIKISKKGAFNATKNRHRMASLLAKINLNSKEKELIFNHFGHSSEVNKNVYQAAAGTQQIDTTGHLLMKVR